jgi:DNA polymerase
MINNCKLCDNFIKRLNVIEGIGNVDAEIIFIFDHPRFKQDRTGEFLSDKSIADFIDNLSRFGIDKSNSYFTFLVKCRPVSEFNFNRALDICTSTYLSKEYIRGGVKKKIMVLVGKPVSNYILGERKYKFFQPYSSTSIIIPIPSPLFFAKSGKSVNNKLSVIINTLKYINNGA